MKLFDFSNGTKGRELADIPLAGYTGGWIVVKDGMRYRVELADMPRLGPDAEVQWCTNAGRDEDIDPADYGVGAVIFCIGEWFHKYHPGHPEAESHWQWHVVGTPEWNRDACRKGILKATKLGPAFPVEENS